MFNSVLPFLLIKSTLCPRIQAQIYYSRGGSMIAYGWTTPNARTAALRPLVRQPLPNPSGPVMLMPDRYSNF